MYASRTLLGALIVLAVAGGAIAAESLPDGMRRCAAIADISVRVACYDNLTSSAAVVAAPTPTPAPTQVAAPPGGSVPVTGTRAVSGAAGAAAYGDADLKKTSAERALDATPKSIDARVTALHELAPNVFLISLDNGQVWQQEEARPAFAVNVGDTVRILSGALGAHSMSRLTSGKTGGWVRVTRRK